MFGYDTPLRLLQSWQRDLVKLQVNDSIDVERIDVALIPLKNFFNLVGSDATFPFLVKSTASAQRSAADAFAGDVNIHEKIETNVKYAARHFPVFGQEVFAAQKMQGNNKHVYTVLFNQVYGKGDKCAEDPEQAVEVVEYKEERADAVVSWQDQSRRTYIYEYFLSKDPVQEINNIDPDQAIQHWFTRCIDSKYEDAINAESFLVGDEESLQWFNKNAPYIAGAWRNDPDAYRVTQVMRGAGEPVYWGMEYVKGFGRYMGSFFTDIRGRLLSEPEGIQPKIRQYNTMFNALYLVDTQKKVELDHQYKNALGMNYLLTDKIYENANWGMRYLPIIEQPVYRHIGNTADGIVPHYGMDLLLVTRIQTTFGSVQEDVGLYAQPSVRKVAGDIVIGEKSDQEAIPFADPATAKQQYKVAGKQKEFVHGSAKPQVVYLARHVVYQKVGDEYQEKSTYYVYDDIEKGNVKTINSYAEYTAELQRLLSLWGNGFQSLLLAKSEMLYESRPRKVEATGGCLKNVTGQEIQVSITIQNVETTKSLKDTSNLEKGGDSSYRGNLICWGKDDSIGTISINGNKVELPSENYKNRFVTYHIKVSWIGDYYIEEE